MSFKAVDIDNGGATTGYDPVLTVPGSALEGDRMTVVVQTSDNDPSIAPTPPATETWTLEASGSMPVDGTAAVSPAAVWIYGKDVSADDETNAGTKTYTWTFGGSEEQCGVLILSDPATFGQFAKNELTGTRTTIDAPSVTTTVANEDVYHCALKDAGIAFTGLPSGDATVADEIFGATSGAGAALAIVREEFASIGATGVKAFTHASEESNGYTFSLEPDAVPAREQEGFRWYEDGTESGSTAIENQDVDATVAAETTTQCRVLTDVTNDAPSEGFRLDYKRSGDGAAEYRPVPTS